MDLYTTKAFGCPTHFNQKESMPFACAVQGNLDLAHAILLDQTGRQQRHTCAEKVIKVILIQRSLSQ